MSKAVRSKERHWEKSSVKAKIEGYEEALELIKRYEQGRFGLIALEDQLETKIQTMNEVITTL